MRFDALHVVLMVQVILITVYFLSVRRRKDNLREALKNSINKWMEQANHNSCHYYPDIFKEIAKKLGLEVKYNVDIPRKEFEEGCKKYQDEVYSGS